MFEQPTVLILGAGASKPFGFPTGYELIRDICTGKSFGTSESQQKEFSRFQRDLRDSGQSSIDTYLENWPEFEAIGKLAICREILEIELENKQRGEGEHIKVIRGMDREHKYISLV